MFSRNVTSLLSPLIDLRFFLLTKFVLAGLVGPADGGAGEQVRGQRGGAHRRQHHPARIPQIYHGAQVQGKSLNN